LPEKMITVQNYLRKLLRLVAVSDNSIRGSLSKNANGLGGFVKNQNSYSAS